VRVHSDHGRDDSFDKFYEEEQNEQQEDELKKKEKERVRASVF